MTCKNCNQEVNGNFCSNCGHPKNLKRIDSQYIIHEIENVLEFERGILFTVKELLINPGHSIKNYLAENRNQFVKPIVFIILTSLFYTFCNEYFRFEEEYVKYTESNLSAVNDVNRWIRENYGYSNILMGFLIAFWTKLFFRKHDFNFFEVLVLLCFVMGIGMLIYSVFGIIQGLIHVEMIQVAQVAGFVYTTWAVGQFYGKSRLSSYVKAFSAYLLGMLSFSTIAILSGVLMDIMIKL